MNWFAFGVYVGGVFVAGFIDCCYDPPNERWDGIHKKSSAEVGLEVGGLALMWPIVFPCVLVWLFFRTLGRLLGVKD